MVAEQVKTLRPGDLYLYLGAGFVSEMNPPDLGSEQACHGAQEARLSGSVRPRQRRRFSATQTEAQALKQLTFASRQRQVFYGQPPDHQSPL
jgi:hypothetical protein